MTTTPNEPVEDPEVRSGEPTAREVDDDERDSGQLSEVASLGSEEAGQPIAPSDATAGYPDSESAGPDEGTAGPDAPPRHGRPESSNESSR